MLFGFLPGKKLQAIPSAQPEAYVSDNLLTDRAIRNTALPDPDRALLPDGAYKYTGEAVAFYDPALSPADRQNRRDNENNALDMATLLETREKERQIERQAEELKWHRSVTAVVVGVLLFVGIILGLFVRLYHNMRRKNKQQADLNLSYRNKWQAAQERIRQLEEALAEQTVSAAAGVEEEEPTAEEEQPAAEEVQPEVDEVSRRYFEELDLKIRSERLFLDSDLSRGKLLRLTPIGKNRLSPLLQIFTGENFNGYINGFRLEYSQGLLKSLNNYTIEAVAIDSGFNNVRTFQRLFREKYGMSPTEYRKSQEG